MNRLLVLIIALLFSYTSNAQLSDHKWHTYGKMSVGSLNNTSYINAGLCAELMVSKNIGLNYNLEYINKKDNFDHFHGSIGTIGAPVLFGISLIAYNLNKADPDTTKKNIIGKAAFIGGIIALFLPDGISYHIPVGNNFDISPYFNFLGVDWVYNKKIKYDNFFYALSLGTRGTLWTSSNITVNAFVETRKVASMKLGYGAGIGVGYTFVKKDW
jgi:hypothetical protein